MIFSLLLMQHIIPLSCPVKGVLIFLLTFYLENKITNTIFATHIFFITKNTNYMRRFLALLTVLMLTGAFAFAQNRSVSGTVSDNSGSLLPGVSVTIPGSKTGATTNDQGAFAISVPNNVTKLVFSNVGFLPVTANIPASNRISIQLEFNPASLDAVVIAAQGLKTTVKAQGVAQTTLNSDQLTNAKPVNIAAGLSGKVAGLQVSAISSGVNPTYRLVLRGMRSLLGDNEALIVLDNVIVPSSILGNLNPSDVENITVLNGGNAAALYGSDGSNGALIITTKTGSTRGGMEIKISHTTMVEAVSNMPKIQKLFGSGTDNDIQVYTPYENQQYGPRFDGSMKPVGLPREDGTILELPYQWSGSKSQYAFWEYGLYNQTDVSLASSTEKNTFFISAQYVDVTGTVPTDQYNRASARINGTQRVAKNLDVSFGAYYIQNRYNRPSVSVFDQVLETPGQIPLTDMKDWRNNQNANPNGFYNAYYNNPYFLLDNSRTLTRNDYFVGNASIVYKPAKWIDVTYRMGFNTRNVSTDGTQNIFNFSDYTRNLPDQSGTYKASQIVGGYTKSFNYSTNILSSLIAHATKKISDFKFDLTGLGELSQGPGKSSLSSSSMSSSISGLVVANLFNLGNSLNQPTTSGSKNMVRKLGLMGKFDIAYKNYLFATVTGRNDWFSTLDPENRSFFYPSAQLSFVATDAIPELKNINNLDYFKLRGGWSKVGNVNINPYSLISTYGQSSGYPFAGQAGYSIGSGLVKPSLKPELTQGFEAGFDISLYKNRVRGALTYYSTTTIDQTLSTDISSATGFSSYLLNIGETSSKGYEASLTVIPIRKDDWFVSLGVNYAYYDNKVVAINADIDRLGLGGVSYAIEGQQFPVILGYQHKRDPQNRIIVDPFTGYPSQNPTQVILGRAGAKDELGFNLEVTYKNLTLGATAAYRGGNVIYNDLGTTFEFSGAGQSTVEYNRDRFVIPNSSYEDPKNPGNYIANTNITIRDGVSYYWTNAGTRRGITENYVTSAAFWKLREISLTYDLPNKWFENGKLGFKGVRASIQGRNLITLLPSTNIYTDPEFSAGGSNALGYTTLGQTPPSQYFGGTINFNF